MQDTNAHTLTPNAAGRCLQAFELRNPGVPMPASGGKLVIMSPGMWVASDGLLSRYCVRLRTATAAQIATYKRASGERPLDWVIPVNCPMLRQSTTLGPDPAGEATDSRWEGFPRRTLPEFIEYLKELVRCFPQGTMFMLLGARCYVAITRRHK